MESQPQNPEFRIDPKNFHPRNWWWAHTLIDSILVYFIPQTHHY